MKNSVLVGAIGLLAWVAAAENKTWCGASGSWDVSANWLPAGVPAAADTVVFAQSCSVQVPSSFAGVFCVSNGSRVAVQVSEAAAFALKPLAGATFSKTGAGVLTARAYMGVNPGTVEVAAGEMVLAGNGTDAAGAFGSLVVKAGATARVQDSPAATRHAGAYRFAASSGVYYSDERTDTYGQTQRFTPESYHDMWYARTWLDAASIHEGVLSPTGSQSFLQDVLDTAGYQALISAGSKLYTYAQALVMREGTGASTMTVTQTGFTGTFVSGFSLGGERGKGWTKTVNSSAIAASATCGWQEFCLAGFTEKALTSVPYLLVTQSAPYPGGVQVLSSRRLWHGVACDVLTVEAGGTLAIAADQAFAVGRAEQCDVAGTVSAGNAGAVFALMGGRASGLKAAFPLSSLAGFGGTVELGATACVTAPVSTHTPHLSMVKVRFSQ